MRCGDTPNPSWSFDYPFDPRMGDAIAAVMGASRAILLGRRTYELFAPTWSTRTAADDPGAPFMNDTPKYVVSSTLGSADWSNSTILGPYSADAIRALKARVDGGIYVSGSGTLVRAMLADGLVDELHLFVFPWPSEPASGCSPKIRVRPGSISRAARCSTTAPSISTTARPGPPGQPES